MSISFGKNKSKSSSTVLTPEQVRGYSAQIDNMSGGRLNSWAKTGTAPTTYDPLSTDSIKALGGLGATRLASLKSAQKDAQDRVGADASLSIFQKQRANQLSDQDFATQSDAINKETEAAIASIMSDENLRKYQANLTNNQQQMLDLQALAEIFYGGKGTNSSSKGSGFNFGLSAGE